MVRESIERARGELAARLRERRGEIEDALLTRTYSIADPREAADPEYEQGLRAAVSAALEYGLAAVERGEERAPPAPVLLLAQAHLAARNGVPLDAVLRRYFAGYTLLGDFIVQEAGAASLKGPWLRRLLREQAALFDRFLATVAEEYGREGKAHAASTWQRSVERVERLLEGELVDTSGLDYDLTGHHIALVADSPLPADALRGVAASLDRGVLLARPDDKTTWAWLGGRHRFDAEELEKVARIELPSDPCTAIGEPGKGLAGWRLSHRQAVAALPVAQCGRDRVVRYADVALLASLLQDDLLATSLRDLYLAPLQSQRDGGAVSRQTLRAYFDAQRNSASAAAALGVTRQTVNNRLRAIEDRLGRLIDACAHELDAVLRLDDLVLPAVKSSTETFVASHRRAPHAT